MSIDLSQFHQSFFAEASTCLDQAESDILAIEKSGPSNELIDSAFRAVHSIKGSAGTLGFGSIETISHELEDCFDKLRQQSQDNTLVLSDQAISSLLAGIDLLRTQVERSHQGSAESELVTVHENRADAVMTRIRQLHLEAPRIQVFVIEFLPSAEMLESGNDPLRYLDSLSDLGQMQCLAHWDPSQAREQDSALALESFCALSWTITLKTECAEQDIRDLFSWVEDLCEVRITPRRRASDVRAIEQTPQPEADASQPTDQSERPEPSIAQRSLQVPATKVDTLLSELSELALAHAQIEDQFLAPLAQVAVGELFARLGRQTKQLQRTILAMRMAPISLLFKRFDRLVRDIQVELGKKVNLVVLGDDQSLDSSLIEQLIDPITHLVRNALDHGIETPEQRLANGKSETATLTLKASHRDNHFTLSIEDDGAGLQIDKIRAKAIAKGLASADDSRSDSDWVRLIFSPGFSTAEQVNQWSGRGVGLDAVHQALQKLEGDLKVKTRLGQGTKFTVVLPLTLALTQALIVKAQGQTYAIAISAVQECLRLQPKHIEIIHQGGALLRHRDQRIAYAELSTMLGLNEKTPAATSPAGVLLNYADQTCVLGVESIVGERQIVIKSLEKNLGKLRHFSNATEFGNGDVVFVLNHRSIIDTLHHGVLA